MWYHKVADDLGTLPDFISYYNNEIRAAKHECKIAGLLEKNIKELPGITEYRFNQLQEIEAILNLLNIRLRKIRRTHFQKYLENYQRALSSRDVEKYVDGEDEVINMETLINEVALVRNQWLGVMKSLDSKNFMMGHLVRLKAAGMEDYSL
jgi:uncharacterized protein YfdQ (DUF2303 family)